jgi:hypothetical protein
MDGVNLTLMVQLEFAATDVPQLLVCAKSAAFVPVVDTLTPVIVEDVLFVSVKGCGELLVPTPWLPKPTLVGVSVTLPTPVPDKLEVCVPALSVTVSVAERAPDAVGVNVTLIVQVEFAAMAVPQLLVCTKSTAFVPVTDTLMPVSADAPPLLSVNGCGELVVPTF